MQISFCPVSMVCGLQNYFLALKMVVSSLFKLNNWRKHKILSFKYFRVIYVNICKSFCPVSMFCGLQNYFLASKMVVSSLFNPNNWRKPKILIYNQFRVICVNIFKSLVVKFQWFVGSNITSWYKKWWFSILTIEETQNIDLRSI